MKMNESTQRLLLHATQQYGPDALGHIEESLTFDEYDTVEEFLKWLKDNDRQFGWNIAEVVAEWEKSR